MTKKRLYIAEKREVAAAIAEAFMDKQIPPVNGAFYTDEGIVTWLSGHLLELTEPEDHDPRYKKWELAHLPLQWPVAYNPIQRAKNHLAYVKKLISEASELVNAGDPDPEGQRLVDAVIEYADATHLPCLRLLVNDNNPAAILKANAKMDSNAKYQGLSRAAQARAISDQRYGVNLTRLYTLVAKQQGSDSLLSVGRVQTPMLGMVVRRDLEHEAHQSTPYYTVTATLNVAGKPLTGTYQVGEDPVDAEGRIIDRDFAVALADSCEYPATAAITCVETKDKERPAPLPYNLLALQAEAAARWGYKPKDVLAITQTLRDEHRAITYNRSDCRYLNDERHADAPELIAALESQYGLMAQHAIPTRKSKAFNSDKVTAHHAIIPTTRVPPLAALDTRTRNIYDLIVKLYLAQFYPPEQFRTTTITFEVTTAMGATHTFKATTRMDVANGWLDLYGDNSPETDALEEGVTRADWSQLQAGAPAVMQQAKVNESHTTPPPRYTVSTFLKDLTRVARYVTDPHIRKLLLDKDKEKQDEMGGIGTPATRDSMIETLFQRGFVVEKGKSLTSTELGRQFIAALPAFATAPDLTALWHERFKRIEAGALDPQAFLQEVDNTIAEEVARLKSGVSLGLAQGNPCPECGDGYLSRRKGKYGYFWGCSNHPTCKASYPDDKGKPKLDKAPTPKPDNNHHCPECSKPLIRRPSARNKGTYWWGCSGYPTCTFNALDVNGTPQFSREKPEANP